MQKANVAVEKVSMSDEERIELVVSEKWDLKRLDAWLTSCLEEYSISRGRIKTLIQEKQLKCLSNPAKKLTPSAKIHLDERYEILIPPAKIVEIVPQNIPLNIVHEDEDIIVINKQSGISVHPSNTEIDGTLVNALLYHCGDQLSGINGEIRPGIVHRIDKNTTGLLVVAKHDRAHQFLAKQFEKKSLSRTYHALIWGNPIPRRGIIEGNIGRHPHDRKKMCVLKDAGKEAITEYEVIESYHGTLSLVKCKLQTGRTHQIRVHFKHKNWHLVGDPSYGKQKSQCRKLLKEFYDETQMDEILSFNRQALHAIEMEMIHPQSRELISFKCDMAEDLQTLIQRLQK